MVESEVVLTACYGSNVHNGGGGNGSCGVGLVNCITVLTVALVEGVAVSSLELGLTNGTDLSGGTGCLGTLGVAESCCKLGLTNGTDLSGCTGCCSTCGVSKSCNSLGLGFATACVSTGSSLYACLSTGRCGGGDPFAPEVTGALGIFVGLFSRLFAKKTADFVDDAVLDADYLVLNLANATAGESSKTKNGNKNERNNSFHFVSPYIKIFFRKLIKDVKIG